MRHITGRAIATSFMLASTLALGLPQSAGAGEQALPEAISNSSSSWTNQEGSTMTFSLSSTAQPGVYLMNGSYVNNAAGFGCQGTSYPLSGVYYAGTASLSFSVAWSNSYADCASVTGWTGYYSSSDQSIHTNWNLAYENSAGGMTIASGSDRFTSTSATKLKNPFMR